MINFKEDENLGQVVEKPALFSFGATPIKNLSEIVFAAGGNKLSQLCGFRFTSKNENIEYKEFFISFVCKLRSKIYRDATLNPSRWFIFKKISNTEYDCLDKELLLLQYGFDVDKFFKSDYFNKVLPKFINAIENGLKNYIPSFVKAHGEEKAKGALFSYDGQTQEQTIKSVVPRYIKSIEDSLKYISNTKYNNKYYRLKLYKNESQQLHEDDILPKEKFECKVKKENDKFSVYEKTSNQWIASFANEEAANDFADNYPKLKAKYQKENEAEKSKKQILELSNDSDKFEKELNDDIEEVLKEIYK